MSVNDNSQYHILFKAEDLHQLKRATQNKHRIWWQMRISNKYIIFQQHNASNIKQNRNKKRMQNK